MGMAPEAEVPATFQAVFKTNFEHIRLDYMICVDAGPTSPKNVDDKAGVIVCFQVRRILWFSGWPT